MPCSNPSFTLMTPRAVYSREMGNLTINAKASSQSDIEKARLRARGEWKAPAYISGDLPAVLYLVLLVDSFDCSSPSSTKR